MSFEDWFAAFSYFYITANVKEAPLPRLLTELEASKDMMRVAFCFQTLEALKENFNRD